MRQELLHQTIRSLRELAEPPPVGVADMQLLARFVAERDEAAFELLLRRHGPMVLAVCRRLLRQIQDAEDAFQATFLILAHKAGSIRHGVALGSWLYRVAYRVALRARTHRAQQGGRQEAAIDTLAAPADCVPDHDDLRRVLDEEINRLPARLRNVFILCCLQGKTGAEAAAELRCPSGTISSRLTRARARLRLRLQRRGVAPAGVALALGSAALAEQALAASLPASLLTASLRAVALAKAGAVPCTPDRILAEGVLRTMFLSKLSMAGLLLVAACLMATCGFFAMHVLAGPPEQAEAQVQPAPAPEARQQDKGKSQAIPVSAAKPKRGPGLLTTQPMTVRAAGRENLHPDIAGMLKSLNVGLGDSVRRGQLLAEIDAPALVLAEKQAGVAMEQAKSHIEEVKARIDTAEAEVDVAKSTVQQRQADITGAEASVAASQNQLRHTQDLFTRKVVSAIELSEKVDALAVAKARVVAARAAVANAESDVRVKQGKVAQARATLRSAEAGLAGAELAVEQATQQLQSTRVRAPFDGIVTAVNYGVGHAFRPGERSSAVPLLTLERTDLVHAVVLVPQEMVPLVAVGSPVVLHFEGLADVKTSGYAITRTAFALDPQSRTMRVEIDVPNPGQQVHPGMSGGAHVFRKGGVLLVPHKAVVFRDSADGTTTVGVYVVRKNQAHFTPVRIYNIKPGEADIEILTGLSPDALVVTDATQLEGETVPVELKTTPKPK